MNLLMVQWQGNVAIGMRAVANVRGVHFGRNGQFPVQDDPLVIAQVTNGIVHQGLLEEVAIEHFMA